MEMAKALFAHPFIETRKTFFGLSTAVVYKPTQSRLSGHTFDFDAENGKKVKRLFDVADADWVAEVGRVGAIPVTKAMGNVLLEVAVSADRKFAAAQVLQYSDLSYQPVGKPRFFEGPNAEALCRLLGL